MPYPALPPRVVSGELITSAWGNLVADELAGTDAIRGGTPNGGAVAAGAQVQIASITLPQGIYHVFYQVLITAVADWKASVRAFVGGAAWSDVWVQGKWDGADANHSLVMNVVADFSAIPAGGSVTFNLINNSTTQLTTYPDVNNHRIYAMAGRLP